ncbi:biotin/lipoyl-containing protein [Carboxylicivirga linearis]|uniref:Biotin/lipoyl-binding protein n=1 Tax=Carboxylicivirga linearis TaxID=1628157 RepID=A0ABS5JUB3_9BACT|nr:biotin/lipoyl-containing protein [Carboxylicivirga linearis]MBS2098056.1 biotin/lipoyl-binding protein [Carboxylicivirga linearis]
MKATKYILVNGKATSLDVANNQIVKINKKNAIPQIIRNENNEFEVELNNHTFTGEIVRLKQNQCTVLLNGNTYNFTIETEKSFKRMKKIAKKNLVSKVAINAMLPGVICDVMVEKNQAVQKGEVLLILEAMKMQNEIVSPIDGVVSQIHIKSGDNVLKDQIMIEIDPKVKK